MCAIQLYLSPLAAHFRSPSPINSHDFRNKRFNMKDLFRADLKTMLLHERMRIHKGAAKEIMRTKSAHDSVKAWRRKSSWTRLQRASKRVYKKKKNSRNTFERRLLHFFRKCRIQLSKYLHNYRGRNTVLKKLVNFISNFKQPAKTVKAPYFYLMKNLLELCCSRIPRAISKVKRCQSGSETAWFSCNG